MAWSMAVFWEARLAAAFLALSALAFSLACWASRSWRADVLLAHGQVLAVALDELLDHARVAAVHVGVDRSLGHARLHVSETPVGGGQVGLGVGQPCLRGRHVHLGAVVLLVQLADAVALGIQLCLDARRLSLLVLDGTSSSGCRAEKGKEKSDPDEHAEPPLVPWGQAMASTRLRGFVGS